VARPLPSVSTAGANAASAMAAAAREMLDGSLSGLAASPPAF